MHTDRIHRLTAVPGPGAAAACGRRYVARRGATGLRVLVHHPYGRVARLEPARPREIGADAFRDADEAAEAIARDALRRPPDPALCAELARVLGGDAPRVELDEDDVRALASRIARVA